MRCLMTYALVGVFAYLETAAFVGLVAPGETVIIAGGVIAGQGEIDLLPLLSKKQRRLKAGMTIEVRLTAPGVTGRAVKFVLKRNKVPKPQGRAL